PRRAPASRAPPGAALVAPHGRDRPPLPPTPPRTTGPAPGGRRASSPRAGRRLGGRGGRSPGTDRRPAPRPRRGPRGRPPRWPGGHTPPQPSPRRPPAGGGALPSPRGSAP